MPVPFRSHWANTADWPAELLDPREAEVELDGAATVASGRAHHGLLIGNRVGKQPPCGTLRAEPHGGSLILRNPIRCPRRPHC